MIFYKPLSIGFLERTRLGARRVLAFLRNCLETHEEHVERVIREDEILLQEDPDKYWRKIEERGRRNREFAREAEELRRRNGKDASAASA